LGKKWVVEEMIEQVSVDVVAFENSTPLKPSPLASPAHLSNNNKSMNRITTSILFLL
jgi:hypothetical protein